MGHYLVLILTVGKDFKREYFPLTDPDESRASAVARWIETQVAGRKRNVDLARERAAERIESARISHPTSYYRDRQLGGFAPPGARPVRKRRR
jgi:hypothetical protein